MPLHLTVGEKIHREGVERADWKKRVNKKKCWLSHTSGVVCILEAHPHPLGHHGKEVRRRQNKGANSGRKKHPTKLWNSFGRQEFHVERVLWRSGNYCSIPWSLQEKLYSLEGPTATGLLPWWREFARGGRNLGLQSASSKSGQPGHTFTSLGFITQILQDMEESGKMTDFYCIS